MKIENANTTVGTSSCLRVFFDLLEGESKRQAELETARAPVKGEIITAVVLGLITSALYDALKLAVQRTLGSLKDDDFVVIDGKKFRLKEIPDSEAVKKIFK